MRIELLGCGPVLGAGEPSPRPGCQCVSCVGAALIPRRSASILVGGRLLVDAKPTPPAVRPAPVPHCLATVAGSDQDVPMPGDRIEVCGLTVRAHPAGDASGQATRDTVVLVVTDEFGRRLLWAPTTGPLPETTLDALAGHALDAVALDALGPGSTTTDTAGADALGGRLGGLAHQIARLRTVGAVDSRTDVIAVGLGHGLPPPATLAATVAPWGVQVVPDGAVLDLSAPRLPDPAPPRRTLVLGPAGSGKSRFAEHLLAAEPAVDYVATGPVPGAADHGSEDPEWAAKVAAHRARRPGWWRTVETVDLAPALAEGRGTVLVDSLGTWLSGVLDGCGAWEEREGWRDRVDTELDTLVRAWRNTITPVVAVSDEVGWGVVPSTGSGRVFRQVLGELNQRLAAESERVVLVVAGRAVDLPAWIG